MSKPQSTLIRFVPFVFVLLWSSGYIGAKYALPFIEPFTLLLVRMLMTLVVFAGLCAIFKPQWPSFQQAQQQMIAGLLVHACYLGGVFAAIKWQMPAGITAIIIGLQPLLTALLGWQWLGERLRSVQWLGLVLGLVGVLMILADGQHTSSFELRIEAIVALILALVAISIGTLYQKRFGRGVDLLAGSFYQYLSTAIAMAILAFVFEERVIEWSVQLMLALGWLVFGLSVSAVLLLMLIIREGEPAKVASYFYLVPPVTAVQAWLLFGESLSLIQIGAFAITVLGVYLVLKRS
ncbi:MAG: DMT family transporter [Pseudomonadales bacterium]